MKKLFALSILVLAVACHAQVPPATSFNVALTWTAPTSTSTWTGCTTASPCVYAVYRCTGTSTACATLGSTAWAEITTSATRPTGTTYSDATVSSGTSYTYAVETVQSGANSGPSNTVTLAIPGVPTAPVIGTPTVANLNTGPLPSGTDTQVAQILNPHLRGRDERSGRY